MSPSIEVLCPLSFNTLLAKQYCACTVTNASVNTVQIECRARGQYCAFIINYVSGFATSDHFPYLAKIEIGPPKKKFGTDGMEPVGGMTTLSCVKNVWTVSLHSLTTVL